MNTLDLSISEFIVNLRNPVMDFVFTLIAHLGDMMLIWLIISIILIVRYKKPDVLKYLVVIAAIGSIINGLILKNIIKRARPFLQSSQIVPLVNEASYSMPSGHSMSSFLAATLLAYYFPKYKIPCYVLACLIAFARVYVGVHFTGDVIVGALVGIIVARVGIVIVDKIKTGKK